MRVFVSYASDDHDLVEPIVVALRGRGFKVFFDKDDLPPGETYDQQISAAIRRSDLIVFMISPASLAAGRYTLTELKFARERFPSPRQRVLPVMLQPTDFDQIPAYLKGVTVLQATGNLSAETGAVLARMRAKLKRGRLPAAIALLALMGGGAFAAYKYLPGIAPGAERPVKIAVTGQTIHPPLFGQPAQISLAATVSNRGAEFAPVDSFRVEVSTQAGEAVPAPAPASLLVALEPGETGSVELAGTMPDGPGPLKARVCGEWIAETVCSDWAAVAQSTGARFTNLSRLDSTDGAPVVGDLKGVPFVTAEDGTLYITRGDAPGFWALTDEGQAFMPWPDDVTGLVTAFAAQGGDLFAAAGGKVIEFAPEPDRELPRVKAVPAVRDEYGSPVSRAVTGIVRMADLPVFSTGGGEGESGLFVQEKEQKSISVDLGGIGASASSGGALQEPPYIEDIRFDLEGSALVPADDALWMVARGTVPSSLSRLVPDRWTDFSGHDYDVVSCADDLLEWIADSLLINDCDRNLVEIAVETYAGDDNRLVRRGVFAQLPAEPSGVDAYSTVMLVRAGEGVVAVTTMTERDMAGDSGLPDKVQVDYIDGDGKAQTLFRLDGAIAVSVAATPDLAAVVLANAGGRSDVLFIALGDG